MHATEGIRGIASVRCADDRWPLAHVVIASVCVAVGIGLFLVFRRATGALSAPLPAIQLVATAATLLVWAVFVRAFLGPQSGRLLSTWLPLCAVLLFAVACSYPGSRPIDWILWVLAISALLFAGQLGKLVGRAREGIGFLSRQRRPQTIKSETNKDHIVQNVTRYRTAGGHDVVRGTLAAEFAPGERTTTLYVAFCPSFERLPHVEIDVDDASSATAKLAQVLHNGVQVEVRLLKTASEPRCVSIELFAAEPTDTI